jgi:UDP-glucose 4-epimerase
MLEKSFPARQTITGKRIFVTGGAGFIGSALIGRLINHNQIVAFDNFSRDMLSSTLFAEHKNLTIINGDVRDMDALLQVMSGQQIIIHCAAIAGIDTVIKSPITTMDVNIAGSRNVLQAASEQEQCERVICFSTSEIFGRQAFGSMENHDAVIGAAGEARWSYAVSKLAEEHLAMAYWHEEGLPVTILRPFNIYGPGQVGEGAVKIFVDRALRGMDLEIHGDGNQIRSWCYIDDMIDALALTMNHPRACGESFNIGNISTVITVYGLANLVVRLLNSTSSIKFVQKEYVDIDLRIPSVCKAQNLLDFTSKINLEEGITRTAEYYKKIL